MAAFFFFILLCMGAPVEKKKVEEYYFKQFLDAFGVFESFDSSGEKPDIRFACEGKSVGVEMTRFFIDRGGEANSRVKQRERQEKTVSLSQKLFEGASQSQVLIEASLAFNDIKDRRIKSLAREIANLFLSLDLRGGRLSCKDFESIPELRFAYIYVLKADDDAATWRLIQSGSVDNTNVDVLQGIINKKENKFDNYEMFEENWLLIIIDFINLCMDQEPLNVDYSSLHIGKFDRVYLFRTGYNTIVDLKGNKVIKP